MSALVAIVGPTATGKSALGLALAEALNGEILACDSTAVYRGIDIGTDKVPVSEQREIPHHLVDLVGPDEVFSAARYGREAADIARAVRARGRVPILVGGTGFYYRALIRGIFPGPSRDDALRARLDRVADRRGVDALHRWLARVDADSAGRIQPRDRKRLVRALEVYLLTGRPLTAHFADTASPIADFDVMTIGLTMPRETLRPRIARRVDQQFASGVVDEVRCLLEAGLPASAHALSGLVYRQVMDMLAGVRNEAETRDLIVRENLRYARRQAVWFRAEPVTHWIEGPGEGSAAISEALELTRGWLQARPAYV